MDVLRSDLDAITKRYDKLTDEIEKLRSKLIIKASEKDEVHKKVMDDIGAEQKECDEMIRSNKKLIDELSKEDFDGIFYIEKKFTQYNKIIQKINRIMMMLCKYIIARRIQTKEIIDVGLLQWLLTTHTMEHSLSSLSESIAREMELAKSALASAQSNLAKKEKEIADLEKMYDEETKKLETSRHEREMSLKLLQEKNRARAERTIAETEELRKEMETINKKLQTLNEKTKKYDAYVDLLGDIMRTIPAGVDMSLLTD